MLNSYICLSEICENRSNQLKGGAITFEEAKKHFDEYYDNKNPVSNYKSAKSAKVAKILDMKSNKKDSKIIDIDSDDAYKYLSPKGPKNYDIKGIDAFDENSNFNLYGSEYTNNGVSKTKEGELYSNKFREKYFEGRSQPLVNKHWEKYRNNQNLLSTLLKNDWKNEHNDEYNQGILFKILPGNIRVEAWGPYLDDDGIEYYLSSNEVKARSLDELVLKDLEYINKSQSAPSVEERAVSPAPSVEERAVSPAPSVEERVVSPAPSVEERAVSPAPSVEERAVSPAPPVEEGAVSPSSELDKKSQESLFESDELKEIELDGVTYLHNTDEDGNIELYSTEPPHDFLKKLSSDEFYE